MFAITVKQCSLFALSYITKDMYSEFSVVF